MSLDMYMPVKLYTGAYCIKNHAAEMGKLGRKCMIVTGRNSARISGALSDMEEALKSLNIAFSIFSEIGPNPLLTDCMRAAIAAAEAGAEFIIGIGGGSPLDAAKCVAVLAANPGMTQEELYSLKWPTKPLPVVAVGTTAGTGSEVTKVSVITLPNGRKKSFHHEDIFPEVTYGDPRYTYHLPESVTISTAIDAFAHSMESYFNKNANDVSKVYAATAIRYLLPLLSKMTDARKANAPLLLDEKEREILYNASIYGGLAINITGTCMPHTLGYLITERHQVPHGYACALFLPYFYNYNKEIMPELVREFLTDTGVDECSMLATLETLLKDVHVVITQEEILREHSRWEGNASIAKSWGHITADMCDKILTNLNTP